MHKQFIFCLISLFIGAINGQLLNFCPSFQNKIYQITATLPNSQPFYGLITLLPNGIAIETNNIANGNSTPEVGINIQFNVHTGYYTCPGTNSIKMSNAGYIYQTNGVPQLAVNGAIAIHYYTLNFPLFQTTTCTGTLYFSFYAIGSNPYDPNNTPTLTSPVAAVTCQLLNGQN
jgi:hypothetical protein